LRKPTEWGYGETWRGLDREGVGRGGLQILLSHGLYPFCGPATKMASLHENVL